MIKVILMDCDGPVIKRDKYFSLRLLDLGVPINIPKVQEFFRNEFLLCETGKLDLKQELAGRIKEWGWDKSLDELLDFWFSGEATTDQDMIDSLQIYRKQGIKCFMTTDQEKYRTDYLRKVVGLEKCFDKIYSSCDVGYLKRESAFWEKIYQDFKEYPKDQVLAWDDDPLSLEGAKSFGFQAELYTTFENYQNTIKNSI